MALKLPCTPNLTENILKHLHVPVFMTDGRAGKLLGWNDMFAARCSALPVEGNDLSLYVPDKEPRDWLADRFKSSEELTLKMPEDTWAGFIEDRKGLVSVRMTVIHRDKLNGLLLVSLMITQDWLSSFGSMFLRAILDKFSGAIGFVNQNGMLQFCNRYFAEFINRPFRDIIDKPFTDLFPGPLGLRLDEIFRQVVKTGQKYVEETDYTKSGLNFKLRLMFTSVRINGEVVGAHFGFQDLSYISSLQGALEERDRLLQSVGRSAQLLLAADDEEAFASNLNKVLAILGEASGADRVYVWSIHPSPIENDPELYTSQLYEWSMGADPQQNLDICVNRPVSEAMPTWIDAFLEGRCINNLVKNMHPLEIEQLAPQGILSIMVAPIMFHGTLWGFIGFDDCHSEATWSPVEEEILKAAGNLVGMSIHNQKINADLRKAKSNLELTNKQLAQAVERANDLADLADKANRSKSEFLANMSHEIRTPMNAIMGMSKIVLETELIPYQRDLMEKVDFAARALLRIIDDILDFSKVEAGKMEIETVPFFLEDVLKGVMNLLSDRAGSKNLEIKINVAPNLPMEYLGDPLRLNQVLVNLLTNAIKFTDKGSVTVTVSLDHQEDDHIVLLFQVADTGIGMPPECLPRLFKPFSQADTSITRRYGGTGLGLVLCRKLLEMMGGRIWCESEWEHGSTFSFTIRLGLTVDPVRRGRWPDKLSDLRILVVDDYPGVLDVMRELLAGMGCKKIKTATSGQEALDILTQTPPNRLFDLVIMDWRMPDLDGLETIRQLRKTMNEESLPVTLIYTAHDHDNMADELRVEDGIAEVLLKPVTPSALYNAIIKAFNRKTNLAGTVTEKAGPSAIAEKLKGMRVLLVEDNDLNQIVVTELLKKMQVEVIIANNGLEALNILDRDEHFEAVLMDVQMPEMDGITATRHMRRQKRFQNLPIIAMTAHAMAGDREKSLAAGMDEHITKPINPKDLFTCLAKWRSRSTPSAAYAATRPGRPNGNLYKLPGLDLIRGLSYVNNNRGLYRALLMRMREQLPEFMATITTNIEKGNYSEAAQVAHTFKGALTGLGADAVPQMADKLEEALLQGVVRGDLIMHLNTLATSIEQLKASLKMALTRVVEPEAEELLRNLEERTLILRRLSSLLKSGQLTPDHDLVIKSKNIVWPRASREKLLDFYKYIGAGERDKALETLKELGRPFGQRPSKAND